MKTLLCRDFVPSSVCNVLAWIVDNDDRIQQDVPADGRKLLVRNVTTSQQALSMAQDRLYRYCTSGERVKTPKHVLLPLTAQHLTKNTELLTLINNCSAACSCNNCRHFTEEGSVVGNDDYHEVFSIAFCVSGHVLHDFVFKWCA